MERKKLELPLNQVMNLELLYNECVKGKSQYGDYFLYTLKNGTEEYSFFASPEVHEQLKDLKRGDRFQIMKTGKQKRSKIITDYVITPHPQEPVQEKEEVKHDNYYNVMLSSYQDALKIQEQLNGMVDVNRISITLFIARSKINGNGYGG